MNRLMNRLALAVPLLAVSLGSGIMTVVPAQNPTAVIRAPSVAELGDAIPLGGAQSMAAPGRTVVSWGWTRISGAGGSMLINVEVKVNSPTLTVASPAANPLLPGTHEFRLVVTDDLGNTSQPASHTVLVRDTRAPTAVISAPATAPHHQALTLSGSLSSDHPPGKVVRWRWTKLDGSGGSMQLNQPLEMLTPTLTVQAVPVFGAGMHRFRLVVVDESGNVSAPAEHSVAIAGPDVIAPTAVIDAPGRVEYGHAFTLSGQRSSDVPPGKVHRWEWTRLSGSGGTMLLNQPVVATTATLQIVSPESNPLAVGNHQFRLVVTDDSGNSSQPATHTVQVRDTRAPTAVLNVPRTVDPLRPLVLDASRSSDVAPGKIVKYTFTRLSGSGGALLLNQPVETSNATLTISPTRAAPFSAGEHRFRLEVTDDSGNRSAPVEAIVLVPSVGR